MEEIWKDIHGWEGLYQCSDKGRIRSLKYGERLMSPIPDIDGYPRIVFYRNGLRFRRNIHRIIAETFIPNPENKRTVNHKNGIKTDYRVDNLEWCTHGENNKHAYRTGLKKPFQKGNPSKKGHLNLRARKILQYSKDGEFIKEWLCLDYIRIELGINNVTACCRGRIKTSGGFIWKYHE